MTDDTLHHNYGTAFPPTHHSALVILRDGAHPERQRALQAIAVAYWKPVYKYLRFKFAMGNERAAELTQSFFLSVIEKDFFASYDASRARFRTFLRTCLDRFVSNARQSDSRIKRGGGLTLVAFDWPGAERELSQAITSARSNPDQLFEREWVRAVLTSAVEALRTQCDTSDKRVHFRLFADYDLGRLESDQTPTYNALASKYDLSVETVTNYLAWARREFRKIVLAIIRDLTASEQEFRDEVRAVLGIDPP